MASEKIVERMARAFLAELGRDGGGWIYIGDTSDLSCVLIDGDADVVAAMKCAIAAMREPTGRMKDAGAETYGIGDAAIGLPVSILDGQPSKAYRAMIDAALLDA